MQRRAWDVLVRAYQGGGTVLVADSRTMLTVPRPTLHDRLCFGSGGDLLWSCLSGDFFEGEE